MTLADATSIRRVAQRLAVEARHGVGSPPAFEPAWRPVWAAAVDSVVLNAGAKPSSATIWFPDLRWDAGPGLVWGDMVRIRTDEPHPADRTVLFSGFITAFKSGFSGGDETGAAYERCAVICRDYRWLLARTSPVFGQIARSPDDYLFYGELGQVTLDSSWTWLSGRRAIFNPDGKPNSDAAFLILNDSAGARLCEVPIFADADWTRAAPWTARDMVRYLLSPLCNGAYDYLPIPDPNDLIGLDHADFSKVLNHIVVEGLNVVDAVDLICRHLGWSFREQVSNDGEVTFVFFKVGDASGAVRSEDRPTIMHWLHAPAAGEAVAGPVAAGAKMVWAMELDEDMADVVNSPFGLGAPDRFEFTAELVPAWLDAAMVVDTSEEMANVFFTESELQAMTIPDSKIYYRYYHARGAEFRRNVSRKWALNEAGRYTLGGYDRGAPFDFAAVIPPAYIKDRFGRRLFSPFGRQLLPCLTRDEESLHSMGVRVEFSFDAGATWQVIPAAITSLKNECGIWLAEPNLAEMLDQQGRVFAEGEPLAGLPINYFTSLANDRLGGWSFKDDNWSTRVRVTATVQMDQRLLRRSLPSWSSGSPFLHSAIYDFSDRCGLAKRADSLFAGTSLWAFELDSSGVLQSHLDLIRRANEDMSLSGVFVLERLWLGDGRGCPDIMLGDCVERITGREYLLSASVGGGEVCPEIVQIVYLPEKQKMQLVTRDLRFSRESLE